jgi:SAM-dependent methyltransferase
MPPETPAEWEARYRAGETPWDSGLVSRELVKMLDEVRIPVGLAIELGCGSGTNAVYLARRGFQVTGVDLSAAALAQARQKAAVAGVGVDWQQGDVTDYPSPEQPFGFVFDRGCYHCVRRTNLDGYLQAVARLLAPGGRLLVLAGNAREAATDREPRVHAEELRAELGRLLQVEAVREFRFQDAGGVEGPLGWSCLARRDGPGP